MLDKYFIFILVFGFWCAHSSGVHDPTDGFFWDFTEFPVFLRISVLYSVKDVTCGPFSCKKDIWKIALTFQILVKFWAVVITESWRSSI